MVRQLRPVYLPKPGHSQDIGKHRLHNQNSDRYQQQILSPGLLPRFDDGVLVLNLSPRTPIFPLQQKDDTFQLIIL